MIKRCLPLMLVLMLSLVACSRKPTVAPTRGDALIEYAQRYPECEPQDLYKLVFQDLYGPGHIISDSASCADFICREVAEMRDGDTFPLYEYTLSDSNYVRVNLVLVKRGALDAEVLTCAVLRSNQAGKQPEGRFHMSHSPRFKEAYDPHYRIVRRDIFEQELLPLLDAVEAQQ